MKKSKKEWTRSRAKALEECCNDIFYAFECPCGGGEVPYMSATEFIGSIAPWEGMMEEVDKVSGGENFSRIYAAIRVSFALGYVYGQTLDAYEAETGLILEALREKKALLYLPHKKKAA
jgi:hypothetical protein